MKLLFIFLHYSFNYDKKLLFFSFLFFLGRGRGFVVVIVCYFDLQLPVQSVPITIKVVSSSPVRGGDVSYWSGQKSGEHVFKTDEGKNI